MVSAYMHACAPWLRSKQDRYAWRLARPTLNVDQAKCLEFPQRPPLGATPYAFRCKHTVGQCDWTTARVPMLVEKVQGHPVGAEVAGGHQPLHPSPRNFDKMLAALLYLARHRGQYSRQLRVGNSELSRVKQTVLGIVFHATSAAIAASSVTKSFTRSHIVMPRPSM